MWLYLGRMAIMMSLCAFFVIAGWYISGLHPVRGRDGFVHTGCCGWIGAYIAAAGLIGFLFSFSPKKQKEFFDEMKK